MERHFHNEVNEGISVRTVEKGRFVGFIRLKAKVQTEFREMADETEM